MKLYKYISTGRTVAPRDAHLHAHWVNKHVGMIDTGAYATDGTVASYVIRGDKTSAMIDVGYSLTWERTKEGLAELGVDREGVSRVFLTHIHLDHAGAAREALDYLPNATLTVHEKGIRLLIDPSRLVQSTRAGFGGQSLHVGDMKSIQPERIEPAREERYDLGGHFLAPIFTPGHMPGHMSLGFDEDTVFSGDALCVRKEGLGLIPAGSPPVYDFETALKSIAKLGEIRPKTLFAPHFGRYPASSGEFDLHREEIQGWRDRISAMMDEGLGIEQVSASMRKMVLERGGKKLSDLDSYTANVLMDRLLGMTVEGYMGYLLAARAQPRA